MEIRLRAQIEQEWKEEMEAARKREVLIVIRPILWLFQQDSLSRVKAMEQSLVDKLQEVDNDRNKLVGFRKPFRIRS